MLAFGGLTDLVSDGVKSEGFLGIGMKFEVGVEIGLGSGGVFFSVGRDLLFAEMAAFLGELKETETKVFGERRSVESDIS